jgi:two-component system chemotaxis response regulator CheY
MRAGEVAVNEPSKVLILEDSAMMCSLYRMVLEERGVELRFAEDGLEGLDLAATETDVDLHIVDVNLPRMDGIAYIRRLRSELGITGVPILVVSTECGEADRAAAYEAGADGYLCKPWQPEQLIEAIGGLPERNER